MKHSVWATVALAAATTLVIAACGSSTSSATSSTSTSASASASSTGSAATTGKFSSCLVVDTGGIDDRSFNASSLAGMNAAAAANSNIKVTYLSSQSPSDYTPNINTFIGQKCGIIVTSGFNMASAISTAAKANPSQKFAIVDYKYVPLLHNVNALGFNTV